MNAQNTIDRSTLAAIAERSLQLKDELLKSKSSCLTPDALQLFENEYNDIRRSFYNQQSAKIYLWNFHYDVGRIGNRMMSLLNRISSFISQSKPLSKPVNDYWLAERSLNSLDEKRNHKTSVRIQLLLNQCANEFERIHEDFTESTKLKNTIVNQRETATIQKYAKILYGLLPLVYSALFCQLIHTLVDGLSTLHFILIMSVGVGLHFLSRWVYDFLRNLHVSAEKKARAAEPTDNTTQKINRKHSIYWLTVASLSLPHILPILQLVYIISVWLEPSMTAFFFAQATSPISIAITLQMYLQIIILSLEIDQDMDVSDFLEAKGMNNLELLVQQGATWLTQCAMTIKLFSHHFLGQLEMLNWRHISKTINPKKIDWWKFFRGCMYQLVYLAYLTVNVITIQEWNIGDSISLGQWLICLPMHVISIAMQTLSEEVQYRRPAVNKAHTGYSLFMCIFISSIIFATAHINGFGFAPFSGLNLYHTLSMIGFHLINGLFWSTASFLSGGIELSWGLHFMNNLFLAVIVGHRGAPMVSTPLAMMNITPLPSNSNFTNLLKVYATQLYLFCFIGLPTYVTELFFRPHYYVESIDTSLSAELVKTKPIQKNIVSKKTNQIQPMQISSKLSQLGNNLLSILPKLI